MRVPPCLSLSLLLCLSAVAAFAAAPPPPKMGPAQRAKLIERLGDEEDAVRRAAAKQLEALGEGALPALRCAARGHDDADVRLRATLLVRAIEARLYQQPLTFEGHTDGVVAVAVSPDGKRVVSGSWFANRE